MRDVYDAIRARGAELVVVGNGRVEQAKRFAEEEALPFRLFTDPSLESYRRAELRRGVVSSIGLGVIRRGLDAYRDGYRQSKLEGDPFQQGGALVIARGGRLLHHFVSTEAGDHPAPQALVDALPTP